MRMVIASTITHIQYGDIYMSEDLKLCARCGSVKPTEEFNKNKWKKDGLQHYCRDCHRRSVVELFGDVLAVVLHE
jgi:RNA polymerase subunit RPABC4/transcription elongation factor Spt4